MSGTTRFKPSLPNHMARHISTSEQSLYREPHCLNLQATNERKRCCIRLLHTTRITQETLAAGYRLFKRMAPVSRQPAVLVHDKTLKRVCCNHHVPTAMAST